MFCYQCQETAKNQGCTIKGVCGKDGSSSDLQDTLVYLSKGISVLALKNNDRKLQKMAADFVMEALFTTVTNVNFNDQQLITLAKDGLELKRKLQPQDESSLPECATWEANSDTDIRKKSEQIGVMNTNNEDIRSLRELLIYGLKGLAAYYHHAVVLDSHSDSLDQFMFKALAATVDDELGAEQLVQLVLECGGKGVEAMALLNNANTSKYGNPEPTEVSIEAGNNPGILISGHDLKDLQELLEQTKDAGIDVYTHGEMLPANAYPYFKKQKHLVGNYGGSWWKQKQEFTDFNGPILMTTNCLVPPAQEYKDKLFTTGLAGYPGVKHIADRKNGSTKDFSPLIEIAKKSSPPKNIESGKVTCGFGANALISNLENIIAAVSDGLVKRFVVMAGCDGRQKDRHYFTDVAEKLPKDTIILTAGCAKFRYNKLDLGSIGPFPRVIDAGQCNDSYSLAALALKLKEVLDLDDINKLPISFDVAWYEQKAVLVLLALLHLGFKNIRLGPTLPAFLSPEVAKVLVENFNIMPTGTAEEDVRSMMNAT